jgi:hypothetical protein
MTDFLKKYKYRTAAAVATAAFGVLATAATPAVANTNTIFRVVKVQPGTTASGYIACPVNLPYMYRYTVSPSESLQIVSIDRSENSYGADTVHVTSYNPAEVAASFVVTATCGNHIPV